MIVNPKNCPCCGGAGEVKDIPKPYRHGWIGCPACGLYIQWNRDPWGALSKWNRRANNG